MTLFSYTARKSDGTIVTGQIDSTSTAEARNEIAKLGLQAEEIHEMTGIVEENASDPPSTIPEEVESATNVAYLPLHETLRLYAGWLMAWYCLVYALGSYQFFRPLPFRIPLVEGLFLSPLVRSFTLVAFLYLLLGSGQIMMGKSKNFLVIPSLDLEKHIKTKSIVSKKGDENILQIYIYPDLENQRWVY